ncbi:MAG: hypothetical protein EOO24_36450 [Comamonadaceae bacterium]|nr:MAG: hypothetical protein EOO24_36450 [Comamonadaceae bacterium]
MEPIVLPAAALVLALALLAWRMRVRARRRAALRRAGHRLLDCLKAYSAWTDWHRDEPLLHQDLDDLTLPPVLAQACQLKDDHFPELGGLMVQLLHAHRELMQYFWEDNILRLTHAGARLHAPDARYHQLRAMQDAALDSLFMRCRQRIGDSGSGWQRTRSDFSFSTGALPSQPPSAA